jgi:hypothetical protein
VGVEFGEGVEDGAAFFCDGEDDAAAVERVFGASEKTFGYGAVGELDDGVVAETETLGGVSDGDDGVWRRSGDLQQELMLLGVQIDLLGGLLAELQEGADLVAEVSQGLEEHGLIVRFIRYSHIYIV